MSLTRSTSADGAILTVQIKGKFDFNLVQSFRQAYADLNDNIDKVVIDLRETDYMDSSALGMLLNMKKNLTGKVETIQIFSIFTKFSISVGISLILWKLRMVKTKLNGIKNVEIGCCHRFFVNKMSSSQ